MLKKSASGVLETREAYLEKRRSFPDSGASRFMNDEDGFFEHPEALLASASLYKFQRWIVHTLSVSAA
jgi:hypothetical protein